MKVDAAFFHLPTNSILLLGAAFYAYGPKGPGVSPAVPMILGAASLTHFILYPVIWFAPSTWLKVMGGGDPKSAVTAFSIAVAVHKAILVASFFLSGFVNVSEISDRLATYPSSFAPAAALVVFGAWLQVCFH